VPGAFSVRKAMVRASFRAVKPFDPARWGFRAWLIDGAGGGVAERVPPMALTGSDRSQCVASRFGSSLQASHYAIFGGEISG
jgi:hypothetical protein